MRQGVTRDRVVKGESPLFCQCQDCCVFAIWRVCTLVGVMETQLVTCSSHKSFNKCSVLLNSSELELKSVFMLAEL